MDRSTTENSSPFSPINSPSTAIIDSGIDDGEVVADDGVDLVEENLLERNVNGDGYGVHATLRGRQFQQTLIQPNGPRGNLLRGVIGLLLFSCISYVIYDFCGAGNIESILIAFLDWSHAHPYKGIIAVIFCYIVATVFFLPGSILTFGAGFAIGSAVNNLYLGVILAVAVRTTEG